MGKTAYELNDAVLGNKLMANVDDYITDQLNYNYSLLKSNSSQLNVQTVQYGVSFINEMAAITSENHQTALTDKLKAQLKDYEAKFGPVLQRQQQP